jgi:hypothetical protein
MPLRLWDINLKTRRKTAITLPLAASVALGVHFAGRETKQRRLGGDHEETPALVW